MSNGVADMQVERKSALVIALHVLFAGSEPFVPAIFLVYVFYFPSYHVYPLVIIFVSWQLFLFPSLNRREIFLGGSHVLYRGFTKLYSACHQFISVTQWPGSLEAKLN